MALGTSIGLGGGLIFLDLCYKLRDIPQVWNEGLLLGWAELRISAIQRMDWDAPPRCGAKDLHWDVWILGALGPMWLAGVHQKYGTRALCWAEWSLEALGPMQLAGALPLMDGSGVLCWAGWGLGPPGLVWLSASLMYCAEMLVWVVLGFSGAYDAGWVYLLKYGSGAFCWAGWSPNRSFYVTYSNKCVVISHDFDLDFHNNEIC